MSASTNTDERANVSNQSTVLVYYVTTSFFAGAIGSKPSVLEYNDLFWVLAAAFLDPDGWKVARSC